MKCPLEERIQKDLNQHLFDSKPTFSLSMKIISASMTQRSLREANNIHEPYSVIYTH